MSTTSALSLMQIGGSDKKGEESVLVGEEVFVLGSIPPGLDTYLYEDERTMNIRVKESKPNDVPINAAVKI
jgi:hypothetical protein